VIILN